MLAAPLPTLGTSGAWHVAVTSLTKHFRTFGNALGGLGYNGC
jgi:hypothetical protein